MPDVFVPQDTTGVSSYLIEVSNKGLILQFSFQYTDRNRAKLSEYDNEEDLLKYLRHQSIVEQFVRFCRLQGSKTAQPAYPQVLQATGKKSLRQHYL